MNVRKGNPKSEIRNPKSVPPYTALAMGYDVVMRHVDYEHWAWYAHQRLQGQHPDPGVLLELGCGTGSLAVALQPLGDYAYAATDASAEMIAVARRKAQAAGVPVRFEQADFTAFTVAQPVDAVLLLYDGLNYLLEKEQVAALFACVHAALRPGGLFLFDQSTPVNSINNEAFFEGRGRVPGFSYRRISRYDRAARLHITAFELTVAGRSFYEEHVQHAYDRDEIRALLDATPFDVVAAYDGFSTAPASDASERIHWLVRRTDS